MLAPAGSEPGAAATVPAGPESPHFRGLLGRPSTGRRAEGVGVHGSPERTTEDSIVTDRPRYCRSGQPHNEPGLRQTWAPAKGKPRPDDVLAASRRHTSDLRPRCPGSNGPGFLDCQRPMWRVRVRPAPSPPRCLGRDMSVSDAWWTGVTSTPRSPRPVAPSSASSCGHHHPPGSPPRRPAGPRPWHRGDRGPAASAAGLPGHAPPRPRPRPGSCAAGPGPVCRSLGVGVTAYGVLSRGLLSGH
jgi:hypothetical protein